MGFNKKNRTKKLQNKDNKNNNSNQNIINSKNESNTKKEEIIKNNKNNVKIEEEEEEEEMLDIDNSDSDDVFQVNDLKNAIPSQEEFVSKSKNFEEVKKSFSELIKKQSLSIENTRESIILVNDFNIDDHDEPNTNVIDNKNKDKKVNLSNFDIVSVIGAGGYGKVYLVKHKETKKLYAMKVLKKASLVLHLKDAEHTKTERQILEEVKHPFIVDLYYAFQTKERLFLLLTFASGGELFSYLQKEKMFDEDTTRFYLSEIFLALDHLHSLGIIYRDLKPENVLLDHEGHTLLTDFGLSKVSFETKTLCGSLEYMAPEIIITDVTYDKSVDYWSFGIMCHDLLTGKTPFTGNNRKKVMEAILKKKLNLPNYLTASAKDLIIKLLRKNPAIRLGSKKGAEEVKKHVFFRKVDWVKVYNKETTPPIVPNITSSEDLSSFSKQFTEMSTDSITINTGSKTSLTASVPGSDNSANNSRYNLFRGFSFLTHFVE